MVRAWPPMTLVKPLKYWGAACRSLRTERVRWSDTSSPEGLLLAMSQAGEAPTNYGDADNQYSGGSNGDGHGL